MKKILSFFNTESLKNSIKNVSSRFPIPVIIILIVTGLFISMNHGDFSQENNNKIIRSILSLIITFFLSVGINIAGEGSNISKISKYIFELGAIIFGIFFYIGFDQNFNNFENVIFFTLTLVGIITFLFFAPYTKNLFNDKTKQSVFYTYFYKTSVVFFTGIILGVLLVILGNIGIASIFALFDISWVKHSTIASDWMILSLSFITPIFALINLPNKNNYDEDHFNENAFFGFIIKYIAIPFIYMYFIILYAYTIKLLSNFGNWPKGEVTWMVIGFSVFGYIIYIFSYLFEERNKFIKTFRNAFPFVVIPQILMLFYAIYLRIAQYDLTINRYFVMVFGIWLLTISLYYILSKKKYLSMIVSSLTIITIIISVGPWSVYKLPESRQYKILESNLITAGILQDGKIVPLNNYNDINKDLSENIYSGIKYLCEFSNCKQIQELFIDQYKALQKKEINNNINIKYNTPSNYSFVQFITQTLKVERNFNKPDSQSATIYFNIKNHTDIFPINTDGYNMIYKLDTRDSITDNNYAQINMSAKKIIIKNNNEIIQSIDLSNILDDLYKNYQLTNINQLDRTDLIFQSKNYKIIFNNISIKNPDYIGTNKYTYANGYILLK